MPVPSDSPLNPASDAPGLPCPDGFDRWAGLAARALDVPVAAIALLGAGGVRRVGATGLDPERLASLDATFCARVIEGDADLAEGRCAGAPIHVDGHVVAAVCVATDEPREWTAADLELLGELAEAIAAEIRLRATTDDLARSTVVVASHNRIHELIAAGAPLTDVLTELVEGIERYDDRLLGSILLLDPELRTVHHGAAPSLPPEYIAQLDGLVIGPDLGSCGAAAWHGTEIISGDLHADPRWAPFRGLIDQHGLRHCWSFPVFGASGEVLGTFGVYGRAPREPDEAHREFLRDAARLAGIAIERHQAHEELVHHATHDPLTGLPNRALLLDRLTQALARSRRSGTALAVLYVDLDRLKLVNDTLGHEAGDDMLRQIGERLAACVRPGDTVARFGGDEFIVVAEEVSPEEAAIVAERIVGAVARPTATGEARTLTPTASVGLAVLRGEDADAREAIRRADEAMYEAKDDGGNRFRSGDDRTAAEAGRRLQVEAALRGALDRGEFHVVAQPLTRYADGEVHGVEALLRWVHPELGSVGPDEFIPIAEAAGIMDALGAWVLREACDAVAELTAATGRRLHLAVNVSPRQLRHADFSAVVGCALATSGLAPELLAVEITETALLGSDTATARTLEELHELGVGLVLDDFGTGFSSLSMLKDHPISGIKIDRSFVRGLPADASSAAIVGAVLAMAHALGLHVTAEGIETREQLEFLRGLGSDYAQGYLLGKPMPFSEIGARVGAPPSIIRRNAPS